MKKSVGQPKKENPLNIKLTVRFTNDEYLKLVQISKELKISKPFLIRSIFQDFYNKAKK